MKSCFKICESMVIITESGHEGMKVLSGHLLVQSLQ